MSLLKALVGVGEPDYEDPQYMKESWEWVQKQADSKSRYPMMPKYEEGKQGLTPEQRTNYQAQVQKHESPVSRWKRQIDLMMASGNPALQEKALASWSQYQNKAATKAQQERNIASSDELSWEEFQQLTPEQKRMYDEQYKGRKASGAVQAFNILKSANSPEEYNKMVANLGMNEFIDIGTALVNPMTGKAWAKELSQAEADKVKGKADEEYIQGYGKDLASDDNAYDLLTYTLEELNELTDATDYSSTGFAKFWNAIPLTDSSEWEKVKQNVVSRLGLEELMKMKRASNTGGSGLGQLSEKELVVLQQYMGNLEQASSPKQIKRYVKKIYDQLRKTQIAIRKDQVNKTKKYNRLAKSLGRERIENSPYLSEDFDPYELPSELKGGTLEEPGKQAKTVTRAQLAAMNSTEEEAEANGYKVVD